jgi:hypothetical protein
MLTQKIIRAIFFFWATNECGMSVADEGPEDETFQCRLQEKQTRLWVVLDNYWVILIIAISFLEV